MKIAFIGSHGLGKTALCYDLAARLKRDGYNADVVKEVARHCPLPVNQKTSLDAQRWILCTQIAEEIRTTAQCDITLCDRSVLDNYAYLVRAHSRQPALEQWLDEWLGTYDLLFYVPPSTAAQPDGFRDVDQQFVLDIDRLVNELLDERLGLFISRLCSNIDQRAQQAYETTRLLQAARTANAKPR